MAVFKDGAGREWVVSVNVDAIELVEQRVGARIDSFVTDLKAFHAFLHDVVKVVRVLWVLCEEQADKTGVTAKQFGQSLAGDALEAGMKAFVQALADFSPSRSRALLRELAKTGEEVADLELAAGLRAIGRIKDKRKERIARREARQSRPTSSGSATSSPESSESIPAG